MYRLKVGFAQLGLSGAKMKATKKLNSEKSHMTDDFNTLDVSWEDFLWQILSVWKSSTYKNVKVIKPF